MVLAAVLAQMMETSLSQALVISQGSPLIFFMRPIALAFMVLAFLAIGRGIWLQVKYHRPEAMEDSED
jgi:putative tricarboxylic transport membrane protein